MDFANETFTAVIDKGTLDALCPPDGDQQSIDQIQSMFNEISRVLKIGGRYLIVTLAQHHIVELFVDYFSKRYPIILFIPILKYIF